MSTAHFPGPNRRKIKKNKFELVQQYFIRQIHEITGRDHSSYKERLKALQKYRLERRREQSFDIFVHGYKKFCAKSCVCLRLKSKDQNIG